MNKIKSKRNISLYNRSFDHKLVERKWSRMWEENKTFYPRDIGNQNKFYNLWMFPYPSAEGLHAGHAFASTGSDVIGRLKRMQGFEVFQPIGYDSFGIHSENYAIKVNMSPSEMLDKTTKHYEQQLRSLGHGYDWKRTVTTSNPDYYIWTQWLFIQMFKAGLAYRKKAEVNWCPSCKTVLADEQVMTPQKAGKIPAGYTNLNDIPEGLMVCERCGTAVESKSLEQWFFRITKYADRLLENLSKIDWPERIKIAQTNWIGKKEGINISYDIDGTDKKVTVWTSRPDTNFGATFIVIAPEHKLCIDITISEYKEKVQEYIKKSANKTKEERISDGREKSGVFTGAYAINNLNGVKLPIYVADFVLPSVGTGAVVGVPGHDKRDFEFAQKFGIPIVRVVVGKDGDRSDIIRIEQVQEEDGEMINSDFLNGMGIHKATQIIMDYIQEKGWGKRESNYHLRDWLISRQRYWGPPIPMVFCEDCAKNGKGWFDLDRGQQLLNEIYADWDYKGWFPVPEDTLPLNLPDIDDFKPDGSGKGPLAKHPEFVESECPNCGSQARRETDVSDTFLDSSWYFLRYPSVGSSDSSEHAFNGRITKNWLPVDLYFGGAEHAVLHLMYARFVTMFLYDLGFLGFEEPFPKFYAHGLMIKDGAKMSKSRGNVVNPDNYIEKFGADTLRLYLMFMGPMDGSPDFRDTGIEGMRRFVDKLWRLFNNFDETEITTKKRRDLDIKMHQTIKKVTEDIQIFHYNTALAAIMEFVNDLMGEAEILGSRKTGANNVKQTNHTPSANVYLKNLALLIAPFAPHLAEEVWVEVLGQEFSIHRFAWPMYDEEKTIEQTITIPIQVNGKMRGLIEIDRQISKDKDKLLALAKEEKMVKKWIDEHQIMKEIYVEGKLINFVV